MNNNFTSPETLSGTAGGTLLVIFMQIDGRRILDTAIIAATGALVSFLISVFCKYLAKRVNGDEDDSYD